MKYDMIAPMSLLSDFYNRLWHENHYMTYLINNIFLNPSKSVVTARLIGAMLAQVSHIDCVEVSIDIPNKIICIDDDFHFDLRATYSQTLNGFMSEVVYNVCETPGEHFNYINTVAHPDCFDPNEEDDRICTQNGYYSDETEDSDEDEDDDEETRSELNSDAYDDVKVNEQTSEDIDTDFVYHIEGDEVYDNAVEEYVTSGTDDEY